MNGGASGPPIGMHWEPKGRQRRARGRRKEKRKMGEGGGHDTEAERRGK